VWPSSGTATSTCSRSPIPATSRSIAAAPVRRLGGRAVLAGKTMSTRVDRDTLCILVGPDGGFHPAMGRGERLLWVGGASTLSDHAPSHLAPGNRTRGRPVKTDVLKIPHPVPPVAVHQGWPTVSDPAQDARLLTATTALSITENRKSARSYYYPVKPECVPGIPAWTLAPHGVSLHTNLKRGRGLDGPRWSSRATEAFLSLTGQSRTVPTGRNRGQRSRRSAETSSLEAGSQYLPEPQRSRRCP